MSAGGASARIAMQVIKSINAMRTFVRHARVEVKTLGLVPTMGSLHEGHLSLVRRSKSQCDATVVSIFVNPPQFGPAEDLDRYPRDLAKDIEIIRPFKVDAVFAPEAEELYPDGFSTWVEPGPVAGILEGAARPGHFRGVATIVLKLLNIVDPDLAFFGQKDLQQTVVIRQMVNDFNLRARIVVCPIVRDADGVALSSRNAYLSATERKAARVLSRSLDRAKHLVWDGEENPARVIEAMNEVFAAEPEASLDSIALVNPATLQGVDRIVAGTAAVVAARVGATRLIDNALLGPPDATEEQLWHSAETGARSKRGPALPPGFAAESIRRQIESCRECAAMTSVVLPPREFLAKYVKVDYPDLAAVRVLVIGRDAPWNGEHYLYRNPLVRDQFTERLYQLLGVSNFAEFKARFAMTDALRCHGIITPLPGRALENCARHLQGELTLFPNLEAMVVLGHDAYLQFQRSILRREWFTPFGELLAEKGWASEEVTLSAFQSRILRVIYCYHLAGGYRNSPSIASMLPQP